MTANGRLPPGWRRVKLGDVCEAVRGITFKSEQTTHRVTEGFIACITTSAVQDITDWDSRRYVPVSTVKNNSQLLKDGDVLVSTANSKALVGKSCLVSRIPEECAFGAFVTVLRTTQAALPEWISSAIRHDHAKQYFYTVSSNTTNISNLRTTDLLDFEIPLPPLEEQKRIVARLNEQMATAKKAKKAAEELLDAARALPNAFLREALPFEGQRLPHGWRWVPLGHLAAINPRRPPNIPCSLDTPTTFVPMTSVKENAGGIERLELRPFAQVSKGYTYFEDGDVLFAKITPCMQNGKHAVARNLNSGFGFGTTEFHVIRPGNTVLPEWVLSRIRQPSVLRQAAGQFRGAVGQQRVPKEFLSNLPIPLPRLSEQKHILGRLREQMAAAERARRAADTALEDLRAIPSALLRRALAGAF